MYYNGLFNIIPRKQKQINISTNVKSLFDNLIRHFPTLSYLLLNTVSSFFFQSLFRSRVVLGQSGVDSDWCKWQYPWMEHGSCSLPCCGFPWSLCGLTGLQAPCTGWGWGQQWRSWVLPFWWYVISSSVFLHVVSFNILFPKKKKMFFFWLLTTFCAPILGFASIDNHYDMKGIGFTSNITLVSK